MEPSHLRVQRGIITITRKVIPAGITAEATMTRKAPAAAPAEAAAADVERRHRLWKERMSEKPAVPITEEPLMTEASLILLMTAGNRLPLSAASDEIKRTEPDGFRTADTCTFCQGIRGDFFRIMAFNKLQHFSHAD